MTSANRSLFRSIFRGLTKSLGVMAGISFWFGGGIIRAVWNTDRGTGEVFGIGIAVGLGLIAFLAHGAAEHFDDGEESEDQPSSPAGV